MSTTPASAQQDNSLAPKVQWDMSFIDDETNRTDEKDWVLEMIEAENGTYLGVGYSRSPLSIRILPTWIAVAPNGEPIAQGELAFESFYNSNGNFSDVVEGDDAYYIIGNKAGSIAFAKLDKASYNVMEEILIGPTDLGGMDSGRLSAAGIDIADNGDVVIVGFYQEEGEDSDGLVVKTNSNGVVLDHLAFDMNGDEERLTKCKVTNDSGTNYDIIFTGRTIVVDSSFTTQEGEYTDVVGTELPAGLFVSKRDANVIFGSLPSSFDQNQLFTTDYNAGSILTTYPKQFPDEYGPFTPGTNSVDCWDSGTCIANKFENSSFDMGYDINILPNGNVGITALLNAIVMTPGQNFFLQDINNYNSTGNIVKSLHDPSHGYHDYIDGEAYFLRIDPSTGNLLAGTQHAGHVSGADSHVDFDIEKDGSIIVVATTADVNFTDGLPDVDDVIERNFLIKLNPSYNVEWRKHFAGQGEGNCAFGVISTSDGGYLVGGNNEEHFPDESGPEVEKFNFVKLAPDCQNNPNLFDGLDDITEEVYTVSNVEHWNTDRKVAGTVRVASTGSLYIGQAGQNNITVQFAYEKYNEDYGELADDQNTGGIIVEHGGRLYVDNATLTGLNACVVNQMWEGIHKIGVPWLPQAPSSGFVFLREGAVIENAVIGIYAGNADYETVNKEGSLTEVSSGQGEWRLRGAAFTIKQDQGGAYIKGDNATFIDNKECAVFAPYSLPNKSRFDETEFICSAPLLDPSLFGTLDLSLRGTFNFAMLYSVQSIDFENCAFLGNTDFPIDLRGIGIFGIDSRFNVIGPETPDIYHFKDLWIGVDAQSLTGGLLSSPYVVGNTFYNVKLNINLSSTSLSVISNNYFEQIPNITTQTSWGISASWPHGPLIMNNSFNSFAISGKVYGTIIHESGMDGGHHYKNDYRNIPIGTQFQRMNQNFVARCSDYEGIIRHAWIVAPQEPTISSLGNQGTAFQTGQQKADNTFKDLCDGGAPIGRHIYSIIDFNYFEKVGNIYPADIIDPPNFACIYPTDVLELNFFDTSPIDCDNLEPPCPEPPCLTSHEDEYESSEEKVNDRNKLLKEYVHWDVHETPDEKSLLEIETAMNFLASRGGQEDLRLLVATLTGLERYSEANTWLNQVSGSDQGTLDFISYYGTLINEGIAGRNVYQLPETVTNVITSTFGTSSSPIVGNAQAIDYVYNKVYHEFTPEDIDYSIQVPLPDPLEITSGDGQAQAYPNPFSEQISFYVPQALAGDVSIDVTNLAGQMVWQTSLLKGNTRVIWTPTRLVPGTYFYNIELPDGSKIRDKIVYLK